MIVRTNLFFSIQFFCSFIHSLILSFTHSWIAKRMCLPYSLPFPSRLNIWNFTLIWWIDVIFFNFKKRAIHCHYVRGTDYECMNERFWWVNVSNEWISAWMNERVNDVLWEPSFYETQASKRSKIKNVVVISLVAIFISLEGFRKTMCCEVW